MKLQWSLLNIILLTECFVTVRNDYVPVSFHEQNLPEELRQAILKAFRKNELMQEVNSNDIQEPLLAGDSKSKDKGPSSVLLYYRSCQKLSQEFDELQTKYENLYHLYRSEDQSVPPEEYQNYAISNSDIQKCYLLNSNKCQVGNRYRTMNGSCNNLEHPSWGMANACLQRFVAPDYADGFSAKRVARSGNPLPSPRNVSASIHDNSNKTTKDTNNLFMVWGQFLDHDIAQTPMSVRTTDKKPLKCCPGEEDYNNTNCDPIMVDQDPFYLQHGVTCLTNTRSARCLTCDFGPRKQMNQVTSYIDASHIYGTNDKEAASLKFDDKPALLKYQKIPKVGDLPPKSFNPKDDFCSEDNETNVCFQTGDNRANQHPGLLSLHAVFLREHNRIVRKLKELNPSWTKGRLFEEARRIVGAEMQMVTYNEYLPLVIGPYFMDYYQLNVLSDDKYTKYNKRLEATLTTEFTTAAFRFGHSMINSYFKDSRRKDNGFNLKDMFNYPFGFYNGHLDSVIEGMTESPSQKFDRHMVTDVTNHLLQGPYKKHGLDLASLNINRGRDHGVPGYTTLAKFCDVSDIKSFKDLKKNFKSDPNRFKKIYKDVEDIDLFSGGLAEKPVEGGVVGPTFACIIGMQFNHLKFGDRFYFEHGKLPGTFSRAELKEIRKVTLGRILCDNTNVQELPKNIFLNPDYDGNEIEPCERKPSMDLNAWKVV